MHLSLQPIEVVWFIIKRRRELNDHLATRVPRPPYEAEIGCWESQVEYIPVGRRTPNDNYAALAIAHTSSTTRWKWHSVVTGEQHHSMYWFFQLHCRFSHQLLDYLRAAGALILTLTPNPNANLQQFTRYAILVHSLPIPEFHQNPPTAPSGILLANIQTDKRRWKQNLAKNDGDKNRTNPITSYFADETSCQVNSVTYRHRNR